MKTEWEGRFFSKKSKDRCSYAKYGKKLKKDQNWTPRATGLSLYDQFTTNRCVI